MNYIASGQKNPERIDKSLSERDQIKQDVQQLKASIENFNKEMDDFDKEKKDLAKEIMEQKKEELGKKKEEISQKKKETQEEIKRLDKEIKENKANDINFSLAKLDTKISEEMDNYSKELDAYITELNSMSVETSFWGKIKETWTKTFDYVVENPWKSALIASGIGLAIWWISKLFKKKEKKEWDDAKKEEKLGFFKRAFKWLGIWVGWVLVWKNRDWIKDKSADLWNSITWNKKESISGDWKVVSWSFEALSDTEKGKYFQLSDDVSTFSNSLSDSSDVSLSDNADKDKKLKWNMLLKLDKKIGNLSNFGNKEMFDFMFDKTTDDYIDIVCNWSKEKIHELLDDYLGSIESFKPFGTKFISKPAEAIKDWLAASVDHKEQLALSFKFYLNTFNYVSEKNKILKQQFAKSQIMWKDRINQEPNDSEEDKINDLLKSDDWNQNIYNVFLKKYNLVDIPYLLNEYNIEVIEISKWTEKLKNDLQEDKEDALSTDENWETCLVKAEVEFLEWWLSDWTRKELTHLCEWMLDDSLIGTNRKSLFDAYTHLITDIFAWDEEYANKVKDKLEIENLANEIRLVLVWYIQKLKNNTFAKNDLDELKIKSESYFWVRERMEITLHNMEDYADKFGVDWWKVAQLPIDAFKDIWKAFGVGKTNSWWERVWYGFGWLYVSGHSLYIASRFSPIWRDALGLVAKWAVEIGKLPVVWWQKVVRLITGRRYLPGLWLDWRRWQKYIGFEWFELSEKVRLLKHAFINWELNERQTLRIAKKFSGTVTLTDTSDLLKWLWLEKDQISLYNKYSKNKNIRQMFFKLDKKVNPELYEVWKQWKYNVTRRVLKKNYIPNIDAFRSLKNIDNTLEKAKWANKIFMQEFLNHVKSLDRVDDLFTKPQYLNLISEISKWKESSNYIKILAKNFHKFDNLDDFNKYLNFLKSNGVKITNLDNFMINSIGKYKDIISNPSKYNETAMAKLNKNVFQKQVEWMKKWFNQAAEKLKKIKVPKQFKSRIDKLIADLKHLSNVSEENFRLLRFWSSNQNWVKKMKTDPKLIESLQKAFNKTWFSNAIKQAKTVDWLKNVFKNNARITSDLPDGFIEYLFKNKNTWNVDDVLKYVNKVDDIGKIWKIITSPSMKVVWRVVGRVVAVAAPVLSWVAAFMTYQEAKEISKHNQERGSIKKQKWHWESTMAVLWWVDAAIALGWTSTVVWAIPAWIVSGVLTWILGLAEWVKYYAYDSFDKYSKNYLDFAGQSELIIKQHISTVLMWKSKVDTWLWDIIARQFKDMSHLADKTSGEWIKALLYTQEWEKNPIAMENTNDIERMKQLSSMEPPITREMIVEAQNEVDRKVNEKYAYFEKKCGTVTIDGKTTIKLENIVTTSIIQQWKSIQNLDKLLRESEFSINNLDVDESSYKSKLDEYPDKYNKLEKLWNNDIKSLIYFHRFSYDYKQLLENHLLDDDWNSLDDKKELIDQNLDYINDFISYKTLSTGKNISNLLPNNNEENDMEKVRNFLITLSIDDLASSKEIFWSDNKFQNILYRIATEVIGVNSQNTKEDLLKIFDEEHEKKYGLYFKKWDINRLCVNWNYFGDQEYVVNNGNILKFKEDLQKKVDKNDLIDIWTWDKILNKEIGERYLKIIDEEIKRE